MDRNVGTILLLILLAVGTIHRTLCAQAPARALPSPPATGEPAVQPNVASPPSPTVVTQADVEDLLRRLDGAGLTDDQRQQVTMLCKQATDDLAAASKLAEASARFVEDKQALGTVQSQLLSQLAGLQAAPEPVPPIEESLAALEAGWIERKQSVESAAAELASFSKQLQARPERRATLRATLLAQAQAQQEMQQQLSTALPANETALLGEAAQLAARARQQRIDRTSEAAQNELALYDAEDALDLPRRRREWLELTLAKRQREAELWEHWVQARREDAIAGRIDSSTRGMERALGDERAIYAENLALAETERSIRDLTASVRAQVQQSTAAVEDLRRRFEQIKDRERRAAGSTALGLRLRQERERLQDPDDLTHAIAARAESLESARLDALDRSDQLEELTQLEPVVARFLDEHPAPRGVTTEAWRTAVTAALQQRKDFLAQLVRAYDDYSDALDDLDREQAELALLSGAMLAFIDERVLWIRSHRYLSFSDLASDRALASGLHVERWYPDVIRVLKADLWHRPTSYGIVALIAVLLQLGRHRRRQQLSELAEQVASRLNTQLAPTLRALMVTGLLAALWPLLVAFVAWRLSEAAEATPVTRQLARNLWNLAILLYGLEFTRHLVRGDGLADAHFDWGSRVCGRIQRWVRRLTLVGLPLLTVAGVLNAQQFEAGNDAWERIAFAAALLLLAAALWDLLHPRTGVLIDWFVRHPGGWLEEFRPVWGWLIACVPTLLAALALLGYYYTAQRLVEKLLLTLAVLEAAIVIRGVLVLWLTLKRKGLAIERARARRAALAEEAAETGNIEASILRLPEVAEPRSDLDASSAQSQRMINTTVTVLVVALTWFIWIDVLPALNYFNSAALWTTLETVPETVSLDGSSQVSKLSVQVRSVTWADLIRVLVVTVLTFTAARNVPGLLEIVILQRLPIDAAMRYALQAFARYVIVVLGVIVVSGLLGLDWSKVQWLAAALTFGLAFGLQEIFANFVSGLIILSEQPVRVGDIVTIDDVTGIVSRIRIRSTTITDWDRKEYIVPNKEFITGKLLNWTLTDTVTRVVIKVGAAYHADPEHVRRVVLEVAERHENVLRDPPPVAVCDGFGESALNFTLLAFLPDLKRRLETVHQLHTGILERFRQEGIEIPFPQRDIRLRDMPPLERVQLAGS